MQGVEQDTVRTLSPSRAAEFRTCALKYRFRSVDRLPEPPSRAAVRGTVVHRVLESLFDLPAGSRTPARATSLLPQAWSDVVAAEPEAVQVLDEGLDETAFLADCASVLERYFALEDPRRLEPDRREEYVETTLDSGLVLRGIIDRVDVRPDGAVRVVDYKTGRAPGAGFEADALLQLKFYALVLWRSTGVVPAELLLIYLGSGETIRHSPDEAELRATERLLVALGEAIDLGHRTGDWQPSPGWACGFCPFTALCPAKGGTLPPLPQRSGARSDEGAQRSEVVADQRVDEEA